MDLSSSSQALRDEPPLVLRMRANPVMDLMWRGRESKSQHRDREGGDSQVPFAGWLPALPFMANSSFLLSAAGFRGCIKYSYDSYLTDKETESGSGKWGTWNLNGD